MNSPRWTPLRLVETVAVLAFAGACGTAVIIAVRSTASRGDLATTVAFTIAVLSLTVSAVAFGRPRRRPRRLHL